VKPKPDICIVNGRGDLGMDKTRGRYIGQRIRVVQFTKGGMVICCADDGMEIAFPQKNLTPCLSLRPTSA
jgi:hypothetical protein